MRIIKLSKAFYEHYTGCPEFMEKVDRPYLFLTVKIGGMQFAIPFRHRINHPYCYPTIPPAGLDYTKAVVLLEEAYVSDETASISSVEWNTICRKENIIVHGFQMYLRKYRHAKKHPEIPQNKNILRYSTLKYFDL